MARRKPVNMTMDEDLLKRIDAAIENTVFRSKSHLFEHLGRTWLEEQDRHHENSSRNTTQTDTNSDTD